MRDLLSRPWLEILGRELRFRRYCGKVGSFCPADGCSSGAQRASEAQLVEGSAPFTKCDWFSCWQFSREDNGSIRSARDALAGSKLWSKATSWFSSYPPGQSCTHEYCASLVSAGAGDYLSENDWSAVLQYPYAKTRIYPDSPGLEVR